VSSGRWIIHCAVGVVQPFKVAQLRSLTLVGIDSAYVTSHIFSKIRQLNGQKSSIFDTPRSHLAPSIRMTPFEFLEIFTNPTGHSLLQNRQ